QCCAARRRRRYSRVRHHCPWSRNTDFVQILYYCHGGSSSSPSFHVLLHLLLLLLIPPQSTDTAVRRDRPTRFRLRSVLLSEKISSLVTRWHFEPARCLPSPIQGSGWEQASAEAARKARSIVIVGGGPVGVGTMAFSRTLLSLCSIVVLVFSELAGELQ